MALLAIPQAWAGPAQATRVADRPWAHLSDSGSEPAHWGRRLVSPTLGSADPPPPCMSAACQLIRLVSLTTLRHLSHSNSQSQPNWAGQAARVADHLFLC